MIRFSLILSDRSGNREREAGVSALPLVLRPLRKTDLPFFGIGVLPIEQGGVSDDSNGNRTRFLGNFRRELSLFVFERGELYLDQLLALEELAKFG